METEGLEKSYVCWTLEWMSINNVLKYQCNIDNKRNSGWETFA